MKKIIFLLGFIYIGTFFISECYALNKSQINSEIRRLIHDSNGTSRERWTDLQISTFINMAQEEIVSLTWCMHNRYSFTTLSGTTQYALPNDTIALESVYYDNKVLPEISQSKLDTIDETWPTASTGVPTYYYVYRTTASWIGFYPSPDNTKSVDVWYVEQPDNLDSDTDTPFNNIHKLKPFHYTIILWVAHYCCLQEGKIGLATQFYNLYALRLKDMKDSLDLRPNYYPTISGANK